MWVVVVAGGSGTRFGGPKQYVDVAGARVVDHSVAAARTVGAGVVVVVPDPDDGVAVTIDADVVVAGGDTRSASVRAGLAALPDAADIVLVHDAARAAASPALFRRVVDAVRAGADGVVPAVPVTDSLRAIGGGAVDRSRLVAVQTPQGFRAEALRRAHDRGGDASDDATLVEDAGGTIAVVDGEPTNLKLTHPHDLVVLAGILDAAAGATDGATT